MRGPVLTDLPTPPPGKVKWPWTKDMLHSSESSAVDITLPRITIVTPSYNQGQFLEETIRSVLLQGYPNLEYIIIDGGSTDGSVDIIRRYAPWLAYWVSEPDQGQVYALAKGFARSKGTILAFLNSDDVYLPNALDTVARTFIANPNAVAVCGNELWIDAAGQVISEQRIQSVSLKELLYLNFLPQPAIFFRRVAFESVGGLDIHFQHIFDFELWLRLANYGEFHCIPNVLAATRWHTEVKRITAWPAFPLELEQAIPKFLAGPIRISLSVEERKAIYMNLMYYAAKVYIANSPKYIRKALTCSVQVIVNCPMLLFPLLKIAFSRALQLCAKVYRMILRRKGEQKVWWADCVSGVHWTELYTSQVNDISHRRDGNT